MVAFCRNRDLAQQAYDAERTLYCRLCDALRRIDVNTTSFQRSVPPECIVNETVCCFILRIQSAHLMLFCLQLLIILTTFRYLVLPIVKVE